MRRRLEPGHPAGLHPRTGAYWADEYDWRAREAALNRFDQFTTEIDGLDIHFIHQRSPHADAFPLIITHGWPGSIVEFHKVIEPLTDPTEHGGRAEDAFHVVCPSLPGYGFSDKPAATGWGIEKVAQAWETLMTRLGYDRYGAQGGDWGAAVTTAIGINGGHCAGIHINLPSGFPPSTDDLTTEEQDAMAASAYYQKWDSGYSKQQSTRPQTLGYGLDGFPGGPTGVDRGEVLGLDGLRRPPRERARPRRDARQRDAVLAHRLGGVLSANVLGELRKLRRTATRRTADRGGVVSRRRSSAHRGTGASRCYNDHRTGRTCHAAATSPRSNNPSCSSRTCGRSSRPSADH